MADIDDERVTNITETPKKRKKEGKTGLKRFVSTVGAGIIGSVLTLTLATTTPLLDNLSPSDSNENVVTATEKKDENSYTVKQVATSTVSLADMVENASKAIVGIVNVQKQSDRYSFLTEDVETGSGSGVIFKKEGDYAYIVTNNHVIEGAEKLEIYFESGEKTTAELIGSDALTDLAVLKIDAKYAESTLTFGDSDALRAGDQVVAIGNPLGLDFSRTVTQGIISAVNRTVSVTTSAGEWDLNVIQTDAAINPGNSGGALINSNGELIGINSLKISEDGVEGLGFAIPSNDAMPLIEEMIKNGKIERPYLGVTLANLSQVPQQYLRELPEEVQEGIMITSVDANSAAGKAGLEVKDIIVGMNDKEIKTSSELRKYLYTDLKVGDEVTLKVYRDGKQKTIKITLGSDQIQSQTN